MAAAESLRNLALPRQPIPAAAPWGMPSHYNRRLFTKDWDPMRTDTPVTVYRKDYQPYPYDIPEVSLGFDLAPESTEVRCVMQVRRKPAPAPTRPWCWTEKSWNSCR